MKQIAVRRLFWGLIGGIPAIAFLPLPALSFSSATFEPTAARTQEAQTPISQTLVAQTQIAQFENSQLTPALTKRDLRFGDQGVDVRFLQRYLSRYGLYPFMIDGSYGQDTADAVATYQRIRDLPATGNADEETLIDMGFDFIPGISEPVTIAPPPTTRQSAAFSRGVLSEGDVGNDVFDLQRRLRDFGLLVSVDGVYGPATRETVRTYQRVQGLRATGVADRETLATLNLSVERLPYVAAVIADESELAIVQQFFPDAYVDRNRRGRFINIGSFASRFPAEARVDAAAARGFSTRVLYQ